MVAAFAVDQLGESEDQWQEFVPVPVTALAPERTLFEKLSHLHSASLRAASGERDKLLQGGRHIYDVYRLLNDGPTTTALIAMGSSGIQALCADVDAHSTEAGWPTDPRPERGYASGPLYTGDSVVAETAVAAYSRSTDLIFGVVPPLEDCLNQIREWRVLL